MSPDAICQQLAEDKLIDGIAILPIGEIKAAIVAEFPDIEDGLTSMTWEGGGSYFEVSWSVWATQVSVNCGYKLLKNPEPLNRMINVLAGFGCALYDPQTGERYTQPEMPKPSGDTESGNQ